MTVLMLGGGSITQAQLVALSAVAVVFAFLLTANVVVCWTYRQARTEDERHARTVQKKKMSDVWVYHVHKPSASTPTCSRREQTASEQILRKIRASHENLRSSLAAQMAEEQGTLGQEEQQVLEELEVTADLFLHDTSHHSSGPSSLADAGADTDSLPSLVHPCPSHLHDLDAISALNDLDGISQPSVTMADFENDPEEMMEGGMGRQKKGRRNKRRGSSSEHLEQVFPVAEFHNEAFDFAETTTAVEVAKDVDL